MKPLRVWIGLVLLAVGIFGVLDAFGVVETSEAVEDWWPVAIIGAGVIVMAVHRRLSAGALIVVAIGTALLADQQGWVDEDIVGPAILIAIGLIVLAGAGWRWFGTHTEVSEEPFAVFGAATKKERSEHFEHGEVSAMFGGATLDLREAHIDHEATVDATAIFGAVDVLVPEGWRVTLGGVPIFGGYDDKTKGAASLPEDAPILNVHATAIFGGVDVANEPT